jgi:transposase-like protein
MRNDCPHCELNPDFESDCRTVVRFGSFHRKSDSKDVERFRCLRCKITFSTATKDSCFRQKKRQKNKRLFELLASGVSQRRSARLLRINRTTVARRLIFFGEFCREKLRIDTILLKVDHMQFDDLETFEHSKCKPLSVTLAVEGEKRRILGFQVAQMSAKGLLVKKALKKYGPRRDERTKARKALFRALSNVVAEGAIIKSDSNPYYAKDVRKFFPKCHHVTCIGKRGAITGQGELKKIHFDPIFSLNHTCAMLRANICRLIRKTWCTTKKKDRLSDHLAIYAVYHNQHLNSAKSA